ITGRLRHNQYTTARIVVLVHYSPLDYLSDLLRGTRYYATSVHVGDFDPSHLEDGFDPRPYVSERDVRQTIEDLSRSGTRWFVDTAPSGLHDWNRMPLSAVAELDGYVREHYQLVAQPAGARVYRRR